MLLFRKPARCDLKVQPSSGNQHKGRFKSRLEEGILMGVYYQSGSKNPNPDVYKGPWQHNSSSRFCMEGIQMNNDTLNPLPPGRQSVSKATAVMNPPKPQNPSIANSSRFTQPYPTPESPIPQPSTTKLPTARTPTPLLKKVTLDLRARKQWHRVTLSALLLH
ncbi:MAG: hypothetical protein Q9188_001186 [Gyalolechia gomerana]